MEEAECPKCQARIVRSHKTFAIFCMGAATIAGIVATVSLYSWSDMCVRELTSQRIGLEVGMSLNVLLGDPRIDQHIG
jgi:hypothetical protein